MRMVLNVSFLIQSLPGMYIKVIIKNVDKNTDVFSAYIKCR